MLGLLSNSGYEHAGDTDHCRVPHSRVCRLREGTGLPRDYGKGLKPWPLTG